MKKKLWFTFVSVLLLVVLCLSFPANAVAETQATTTDKVYYSDLFYGYDTSYLSESTMLKLHANQTSNILADIYNDFADSDAGFWSMFKTGLNMSTSALFKLDFREYAKLMSDTYGNTDYIYTNSLDSANKIFAESLLQSSKGAIANDAEDYFGAAKKVAKRAKSLLKVYDTFEKNYDIEKLTDYEIVYTMFEYIKGEGIFLAVGSANITKIEEVVLKDVAKYVKMVGNAADALEAVQTIFVGIMLEDVRMEIVNEILASAPTDSCIYDGMTRLKNHLSGGFITYFAENYLKETVLDTLVESVTKPLLKTIREGHVTYAIVGDALSVASWVVFDVIFDVPDLGDMTTQKTLSSYADDLYQLLKTKTEVFNSQFDSEDILKFEAVFDGYIAATNAALKQSQSMALDSNRPELDGVTYVWKDFCYSQYTNSVKETIENTPATERKVKYFETWTNPSGTFRNASDTIEADSIYLFDGALNANVKFIGNSTIISATGVTVLINGNVDIHTPLSDSYDGTSTYRTVIIPEDSSVTITGKLTVGGGGFKNERLENNGTLTCLGDVEFTYSSEEGTGYYKPSADSKLIVKGNLYVASTNSFASITQGTIEFAGTEQQEIYLPRAYNIEVTNPKGIKYMASLSLYGNYKLNNNPLNLNGFITYLNENSSVDNSDFINIQMTNGYIINCDINADVKMSGSVEVLSGVDLTINGNVDIFTPLNDSYDGTSTYRTVTIPEDSSVTITGKLTVGGGGFKNERLENNGTLTCLGDVEFTYSSEEGTGYYKPSADSKLIVKGNLYVASTNSFASITQGTIEFAGTEQQEIYLPRAYNIEVTNPKGIKYLTNLSLYGKYNLNDKPLYLNGFYTYLCGENSELDGSDFQEVKINTDYTLKYNIKANVHIYNSNSQYGDSPINITIPEGVTVQIGGEFSIGGLYHDAYLINNGTLICEKGVTFAESENLERGVYKPSANSKLIVKGKLTFESYSTASYITQGTIEFAGTEQQEIDLPKAFIIEINNISNEGVVFTSSISVKVLFNHKGNNFTLHNNGSGSTFVDYDGDGLLDNIDPHPTVPESQIEYTVIFKDDNGDVLSSEKYHYGDTVVVPVAPTKDGDKTYYYVFAGWDKEVTTCTGDAVYTATYTPKYNEYTVVFKDGNGSIISEKAYHYGDTVVVPNAPVKASDNTYTYTFNGWDKAIAVVEADVTYTAVFTPVYINYTVVFKNYDGSVISSNTYHYSDNVVIPSKMPSKPADNKYTYTFNSWDKDVVSCAGNAVYTAQFDAHYIEYAVVFKDENGEVLSSKTYHYGDAVSTPTNPTKAADNTYTYAFSGWDKTVVNCAGDATYTATYAPTYINYTVVFKDYDGSIIRSATYHYGDTITVPNEPTRNADNTYTYAFSGWSSSVSSTCNGNVTYTAAYSSAYVDYTVIFKNYDGSILSSNTYHYGDIVTMPSVPQKPNDGDISYTFTGWDKEVSTTCNANVTYTAIFKVAEQEMLGDTNSDDTLNSDDAIYLLKHSLFPDMYPINQTSDFDGNGETNSDDAIYLLKHTLFPDMYPLHDSTVVVLALPPQNVKYKDDSDDGEV